MNTKHGILVVGIALLVLCAFAGTVSAEIYVPDDYPTIQQAVDNASAGDTIIVRDGTYTENVDAKKSLTIKSESGAEKTIVQAANSDDHVFEVTADYVNISGFTVKEATDPSYRGCAGIYLYLANHCNISNNICSNNRYGIRLCDSSNNSITNNICSNNDWDGIILDYSYSNSVSNNTCSNNERGIFLAWSNNNSITNNNCFSNNDDGIYLFYSHDNSIANNIFLLNNDGGIDLYASNNNSISNNNCSNNVEGIHLMHSNSNSVSNNICLNSLWTGIGLSNSSNSSISNNNCSNNYHGIHLYDSSNNSISNNNCSLNNASGIHIGDSNNTSISNNNCSSNNLFGVYLNSSYNDIIISNSISNSRYGIYLYSFSNNKIYLNNFINNTNNVHSSDSTNIWNSTSPITYTYNSNTHTNYFGNYWSDYTGSDADGDGIGEIPYSIDSDKDNYPLMEPFEHYYLESPWPMFRHDAQHTGRSPFVGPGAETPEVHVLVEGGQDNDYISTPIIGSDGTLYLTARITIAGTKEGLFAFNSDGTQKWFFEGQFSMPALLESAKTVYVFPNLGVGSVSAVNTENGILKWNKPYFLPLNLGFPVVGDNGILYFITLRFLPEESYWYLIGLDESGNEVLSYNIGVYRKEYEVSLPTIDKEGTIYLGYNNTLLAINPNGTEKWQRTFIGEYHYRPPTTPSVSTPSIADDGTLYVVVGSESDMDGAIYMYLAHLHAIDPENPTEDKWMRICGEHCSFLSLSSEGNIYLWGSYETSWGWRGLIMGFDSHGNVLENWPLDLSGGGLLLIDKEGYIYGRCSDPNTIKAFNQKGEERWSVYLGRHDDSFLSLGADGTLYAGGRKKLYAIKPFIAQNQPPNPPTNLAQLKSDSETIIPVGATTDERTVIFKGTGSDPDGDKVKLQVELRRLDEYGGQFNETAGGFKESDFVESGNETTAYAYGLIDADYHWRARTVDERGAVSEWMDFGNNDISDADFTVKVSNPPQANAGGPYHGDINEIIQFNGSGTDPDGDAIIGYAWDFDNDGITDSTVQNSTFSWSEAGMYHPTLKVQDARGKWSWLDSCEVNVYEEKPHIGPYPLSMYDRYYVHIFNIDDIGRAYVNGTLVTEVSFGADSSATDITDYLQSGNNEIRFTVENLKEGYTYGFEIIHADGIYHTIWPDSNGEVCGVVGVEGCKDNDQQTGIVYNKTIILELKEREFEDFTFVHLTDVHIGWDARSEFEMHKDYEDLAKEYRESYERFTATLNSINDLNPKPAFILVTGDDVEYNSETFFNGFILAIYSFTRHNDIPFYFIPGNHDRREKMPIIDDYLTNYHKYIPPTIGSDIDEEDYLIKPDNYTFEYGGYLFVGLDSGKDESYAGPQNKIIDWAPEGAGLSTQIIWELVTLEENKKIMPKIIFMHHPAINEDGEDDTEGFPAPVAPNGPGGNDACIANNRELFIEYCTVQKYDVCLVLTGHTHTQKFLDAEGEQVRVYTDGYYGDMKPLFVQTRSATKDDNDNGLTHGFLEVKVGADGIRLIPHPREGVIIPPEHYLCSVTGPVNLHAYDSQGRHTGFGSIDVNIPPAPSTQETIMEQLPQCHK